MFDEASLMQRATLRKRFEDRVPGLWLREFAMRNLKIKFGQITAIQMPDQIACAELNCLAYLLHVLILMLPGGPVVLKAASDFGYRVDFGSILPNPKRPRERCRNLILVFASRNVLHKT